MLALLACTPMGPFVPARVRMSECVIASCLSDIRPIAAAAAAAE